MTSASNPGPTPPPVVCTLTSKDLAARRLEWSDLAALAIERERIPGGVRSTYPAEHAGAIEDLVGRELECCGTWLRFAIGDADPATGTVKLEVISLNEDGEELLASMVGLR